MNKFYSKNYWSAGFHSKLYDLLSPESYFDSLRRVVAALPVEKNLSLLDAGCGSGLLLQFLQTRIREGMVYTGMDLLNSGVGQVLRRARNLGVIEAVSCFQSDFTKPLPVSRKKFDLIVVHFSLYTLKSKESRKSSLENLRAVLKQGGRIILVNPSVDYNPDAIIEQSIQLIRERQGLIISLIKKYMIYPFTKILGLRFIQKQLKSEKWQGYTHEKFSQEIEEAGFAIQKIEKVYAESAFLGIANLFRMKN